MSTCGTPIHIVTENSEHYRQIRVNLIENGNFVWLWDLNLFVLMSVRPFEKEMEQYDSIKSLTMSLEEDYTNTLLGDFGMEAREGYYPKFH